MGEVWDGIEFDDDVYEEAWHGACNETVVVDADAPVELVVAALQGAGARMMRIGEDGGSYEPGEVTAYDEIYTPNYVSDVTIHEDGNPGFYIDCKGAIDRPMATQFRRVLAEELRLQGVLSARVRVPRRPGG